MAVHVKEFQFVETENSVHLIVVQSLQFGSDNFH